MVTAESIFSLIETQGPLVAKIARNALAVYNAIQAKQFFSIFTLGQTLADDVTKLVATVKGKFAEPVKTFAFAGAEPARFVEPVPLPEFRCCNDPADCVQPCSMKSAAPAPVGALAFGKGPGHRLFARYVRSKLRDRLKKDGFALIGGDGTPLTDSEIDRKLAHLDDDTVLSAGQEVGAIGDGRILQGLRNLLEWLLANGDKIGALIQFLLRILAAF